MVDDGYVHAQTADQLQWPQARRVLVASQAALQELLVREEEDGAVATRDVRRHLEDLNFWFRAEGEEEESVTGALKVPVF